MKFNVGKKRFLYHFLIKLFLIFLATCTIGFELAKTPEFPQVPEISVDAKKVLDDIVNNFAFHFCC